MTREAIQTFSYRISQASKSQLVVILYDMALEYLKEAREYTDSVADNKEESHGAYADSLRQCGRAVDLLIKGLDFQYDISGHLFQIYLYIKKQLVKCITVKDSDKIMHLEGLLKKLRASFYEVSKTDASEPLMKNTQQIYSGLTYSNRGSSNEVAAAELNRGFKV
ncbi:MAG: flagellar protein FliS [Eubacteriales bacterium]|nr:flagellar protein FliS [Eubacteriales bacterium]